MKRAMLFCVFAVTCLAPLASAQEHGEVGAFVDYLRVGQLDDASFGGLGGRVALNPSRYIGLEAEMSYNFNQVFTESFTNPVAAGGAASFQRSPIRTLDGLFGPTVQTGHGPVRLFATLKGGFMDFRFDPRPATFNTFTSSVTGLRDSNWNAAMYPGGGVEAHWGPIGLRLDVGDEIYFNGGAHNNLRITFGPTIRF
jgi:hypothetical protein